METNIINIMKNLKLKQAWFIDHNLKPIKGFGYQFEILLDGVCEYTNKAIFTEDGKKFYKEDWSIKIFFEYKDVIEYLKNKNKETKEFYKREIKRYQAELEKLDKLI